MKGEESSVAQVRSWIRLACRPYRSRLGIEIEDVEQEILLALVQALRVDRFRRQSSLRTYVRTYVHHKCIDRLRFQNRRNWVDIEDFELPSTEPGAFELLSRRESDVLATRVLARMPDSCREVWGHLMQGLSYQEMSKILGVSEGTLRVRVLRCRKRAIEERQRLLSEYGGS